MNEKILAQPWIDLPHNDSIIKVEWMAFFGFIMTTVFEIMRKHTFFSLWNE